MYCCTFSFLEIAFTRTHEVNVDFNVFADKFLAQELPRFLSIEGLLGIGKSARMNYKNQGAQPEEAGLLGPSGRTQLQSTLFA